MLSLHKKDPRSLAFLSIYILFILVILIFQLGLSNYLDISIENLSNEDPNSMYPTYHYGDKFLIYKADPEDITPGDVVIFKGLDTDSIIHRVRSVFIDNGDYYYLIKGDSPNNTWLDISLRHQIFIPYEDIKGKVITQLHLVGEILVYFIDSPVNVIILLIITFLIFYYRSTNLMFTVRSFLFLKYDLAKAIKKEKSRSRIPSSFLRISILIFLILILGVLIYPLFYNQLGNESSSISSITLSQQEVIYDNIGFEYKRYVYFHVVVVVNNSPNTLEVIDDITLKVYHDHEVLYSTVWLANLQSKDGNYLVGLPILIDLDLLGTTPTTVVLSLTLHSHLFYLEFTDVFSMHIPIYI
jgi:signal peptidase I